MVCMILGGSGSGKSSFAETYVCQHYPDYQKYYLATMPIYGKEDEVRVKRHRALRAGKGFLTIERQIDVDRIENPGKQTVLLLECLSNLVANEMFQPNHQLDQEAVVSKVSACLERLSAKVDHLVIVSNNVFEEGVDYEESTRDYLWALGELNRLLAARADLVCEVIVGIPLVWKGSL